MPKLPHALRDWNTTAFAPTLKGEIERLDMGALPLGQGIEQGSYVGSQPITAMVLQSADAGDAIEAKVGVFFTEIVASCGCGAEPMEQNAYCELRVRIDKATAEAAFAVIPG